MRVTQELRAFLAELRTEIATIPGLDRAYDRVPDSINETPSILAYPVSGNFSLDTHGRGEPGVYTFLAVHTIRIDLLVSRADLDRDLATVEAFTDTLPVHLFHAFIANRFRHTLLLPGDPRVANNAVAPLRYRIVEGAYGSDQIIGHQLELDVVMQQEVITDA